MGSILAQRGSSKTSAFHITKIALVQKPDAWRKTLVFVALLGAYTNFALHVGVLVFGILAFLAGGTLALIHLRALHRHTAVMAWFLALCLFVDLGGSAFPSAWLSLLQSTLLLIGCVFAGFGVLFELRTWPSALLRRWFLVGAVIVTILGALEYISMFRAVSDTVRQVLYDNDNQFLYEGDERDLALHGAVRPKVFTQEPSHPAKFVGIALAGWHLLSKHRHRTALALTGCAIGYMVLRAPSIVVGPAFIAYFALLGGPKRRPFAIGLKVVALVAAFIAMLTFVDWVGFLPGARAHAIANNEDGSIIMRLTGPISAARGVIENNPLFGLGIGGKESASDMLYSIYAQYDFMNADYHFAQNEEFGWGNGFFQFLAFFGMAGTAMFIFWFRTMCERFVAPDWPSCLIILVLLMAVDGGFNMVRPWIYFFVLAAVLHIVYRRKVLAWTAARSGGADSSGVTAAPRSFAGVGG